MIARIYLLQIAKAYNTQTCDLDLDSMTLIYVLDLTILKTYVRARNELSRSRISKVSRLLQEDSNRQTDRQTDIEAEVSVNITIPACGW